MLNIKCLKKISLERHEIIFLFTLPTSLSSVRFTVSHGYVVFSKLKPKPSVVLVNSAHCWPQSSSTRSEKIRNLHFNKQPQIILMQSPNLNGY